MSVASVTEPVLQLLWMLRLPRESGVLRVLQMRCACALMCLCAVYPYVVCLCLRVRGLWGLSEKAVHELFAVEYAQLVDACLLYKSDAADE